MPNLPESSQWEENITLIEEEDWVEGGLDGIDNKPHRQLANRTQYLKVHLDELAQEVAEIPDNSGKFDSASGHKHTGVADDAPKIDATGLTNGAATDTIIGNRTINDTEIPTGSADTLTKLLGKIGNIIKAITGKTNWFTAPVKSIEQLNNEKLNIAGGTMQGALNLAADPTAAMHATTKQYVDEHAGVNTWKPNRNYSVPSICYAPNALSYKYLECIVAGVSGNSEPMLPDVGHTVTDGTVTWVVRDIRGNGVPIGTITPRLALSPAPGELACDTGALINRATYPALWEWVQAHAPLVTEAEWQAQAAVQSSVGYYSSGDGSTTFRLPRILDYPRGGAAGEVGHWQGDAIRNITGDIGAVFLSIPPTGVFKNGGAITTSFTNSGSTSVIRGQMDASLQVPTADENRPKTIKFLFCVKAFDAPTNQGLIDITALSGEVLNKVSKTETGYRVRKWVSGEYTPVVNTPCIVSHGLAIDPENCVCDVRLKCVVAEGGYSVGDFAIGWYTTAAVSTQGTTHAPVPKLTASEIQFNTGDYTSSTTNGIGMLNKNSGAYVKATLANWRYVFRIFY